MPRSDWTHEGDSFFPGSHTVDWSTPSRRSGGYESRDPFEPSRSSSRRPSLAHYRGADQDPTSRMPLTSHADDNRYSTRRYTAGLGGDDAFSRALRADRGTSSRYDPTGHNTWGRGTSRYESEINQGGRERFGSSLYHHSISGSSSRRSEARPRRQMFESMASIREEPSSRRESERERERAREYERKRQTARQASYDRRRASDCYYGVNDTAYGIHRGSSVWGSTSSGRSGYRGCEIVRER